jgi:hypothetical protein
MVCTLVFCRKLQHLQLVSGVAARQCEEQHGCVTSYSCWWRTVQTVVGLYRRVSVYYHRKHLQHLQLVSGMCCVAGKDIRSTVACCMSVTGRGATWCALCLWQEAPAPPACERGALRAGNCKNHQQYSGMLYVSSSMATNVHVQQ